MYSAGILLVLHITGGIITGMKRRVIQGFDKLMWFFVLSAVSGVISLGAIGYVQMINRGYSFISVSNEYSLGYVMAGSNLLALLIQTGAYFMLFLFVKNYRQNKSDSKEISNGTNEF